MSPTANSGSAPAPPGNALCGGDAITLGDVMAIHRAHAPAKISNPDPAAPDQVRFVGARGVAAFEFTEPEVRAGYRQVIQQFAEHSSGKAHTAPWREEVVFAPVKLVICEREPPLRAVLAYEPIFPARAKLAVPHPGQPLWLAYAAAGVLNSWIGQAVYYRLLRELCREPSRSGVDKAALARLPLARADYTHGELHAVAELVHQIQTLLEARSRCGVEVADLVDDLRLRLDSALVVLLGLSHEQARVLEAQAAAIDVSRFWPSGDPHLFRPVHLLPRRPSLELLSAAERETLESRLPWEERSAEQRRLMDLLHWENVLRHGLPREIAEEAGEPSEAALATRTSR